MICWYSLEGALRYDTIARVIIAPPAGACPTRNNTGVVHASCLTPRLTSSQAWPEITSSQAMRLVCAAAIDARVSPPIETSRTVTMAALGRRTVETRCEVCCDGTRAQGAAPTEAQRAQTEQKPAKPDHADRL